MKPEKKKHMKCNIISQAYRSTCSWETHQVIKTFRIVQQGEGSLIDFRFPFDGGAFLNHNPIIKPAKNNKRTLIAAIFHLVNPVQKER